jgi:UDP-2,3-diacylglucosamine pyrophosphatase LpxH
MKEALSLALALALLLSAACAETAPAAQPLYEVTHCTSANKLVVISDIHLGVDDAYAETVKNKPLVADFLRRVAATPDIAEVVIAGDFFDEWFQPFSAPAHTNSAAFYRAVAANNETVVAALRDLIATPGKTVTYVPGNHDITLDAATVEELFPGIRQARDVDGLGVYRAGKRSEIVIEHGHRYNVFVAPDAVSNSALTGGKSILPPGYFYTRIGATFVAEGRPKVDKTFPIVTDPGPADISRYGAYLYNQMWMWSLTSYPVLEALDEKTMDASFAGFPAKMSILDLLPQTQADGSINASIFPDIQNHWEEVQTLNQVPVHSSFVDSVMQSASADFTDSQAKTQYFDMDPSVEVVVFGHTHAPKVLQIAENKVYANSGTWIDHNTAGATGTFVLVGMGEKADTVDVYQYGADGSLTKIAP